MIKKFANLVVIAVTFTIITSLFSGCSKNIKENSGYSGNKNGDKNNDLSVYPLKTNVTLKYFVKYLSTPAINARTMAEYPLYKELEKRTGVKIEFIHQTSADQLTQILASGDLPDMFEGDWYNFAGGPEKALNEKHIIQLNDVIDKYAPNLKKYIKDHPEIDKMLKTDSGAYYEFPFIRGDKTLQVYQGPMIRKDWLDEFGLNVPETIDDWYKVLKVFRDKKTGAVPLSFPLNYLNTSAAFIGAFGVRLGLYVQDGKIKYGQYEQGYKDFLNLFRKWYSEGLIDKNIGTMDMSTQDTILSAERVGATIGNTGGGIGKWTKNTISMNPKFKLVAAPYPTLKSGDTAKFGQWDLPFSNLGNVAISSKCKDIEVAAKWLDYGYSEEGRLLMNFGIEGQSYKMDNGYPRYTDLITNNSKRFSMADMLNLYTRAPYGPTIEDPRYMEQYAQLPEQKESLKIWSKTEADKTILPKITLTPAESVEAAQIENSINTYNSDMFLKFIMGIESIDNFDAYRVQLKKMGIERYIQLYQQALDRYNKR